MDGQVPYKVATLAIYAHDLIANSPVTDMSPSLFAEMTLSRGARRINRSSWPIDNASWWADVCSVSDSVSRQAEWDVHIATTRPKRDIGTYTITGCKSTCRMGNTARVMKKFQCTPYSVTCS